MTICLRYAKGYANSYYLYNTRLKLVVKTTPYCPIGGGGIVGAPPPIVGGGIGCPCP